MINAHVSIVEAKTDTRDFLRRVVESFNHEVVAEFGYAEGFDRYLEKLPGDMHAVIVGVTSVQQCVEANALAVNLRKTEPFIPLIAYAINESDIRGANFFVPREARCGAYALAQVVADL